MKNIFNSYPFFKNTFSSTYLVILTLLLFTIDGMATTSFISTWKTNNTTTGGSSFTSVMIPTNPNYTYNYDVDWNNDGVFDDIGVTGTITHNYGTIGTYQIAIRGNFPAIYFNDSGDKHKLLDIVQWGTVDWKSFEGAFEGCINMNMSATDLPDLNDVTNMSKAFFNCNVFNGDLSGWDVSNVTDMSSMLHKCFVLSSELSNWDVSSVTDMSSMFSENFAFNANLSTWDVSNVTNMSSMFYYVSVFNGNISAWDVSSVTDMSWMFLGNSVFNRNLSTWDVSSVTNMNGMFQAASIFNGNLSTWDVSSVTNMLWMFGGAFAFNSDLSAWDVSSVTNMSNMFFRAEAFNQNLSNWDVSNVTDMSEMFSRALVFNGDISTWDVSSVTTMYEMFIFASAFDSDLSNWDVSSVTTMQSMFSGATVFTSDLSNWDVSSVVSMGSMFSSNSFFTSDLSAWDVSNVVNLGGMFYGASLFTSDLSSWDVSSATNLGSMFGNTSSFNSDISSWDVSSATYMAFMFYNATAFNSDLSSWDVSSTTNMYQMFNGASSFNSDLSNWNLSNMMVSYGMNDMLSNSGLSITNYDATLSGWSNLPNLPQNMILDANGLVYCNSNTERNSLISNNGWTINGDSQNCSPIYFITTWKTDNLGSSNSTSITIPTDHFNYSYNYDVDWNNDGVFDSFGLTGNATHDYGTSGTYQIAIRGTFPAINFDDAGDKLKILNINQWGEIDWKSFKSAFRGCANLTTLSATDTPDLDDVTSMLWMFQDATSFNSDLSSWDVSNITDMSGMFWEASAFNQDLSSWDVSSVTNMSFMFYLASSFNGNISTWDVSSVTNMVRMFSGATAFNNDLSTWDVSSVTNMSFMFLNASSFNSNLSSWDVSNVTNMSTMFQDATSFNSDLSNWNVANVTNMSWMFQNATSFNSDLSTWNISSVTSLNSTFNYATSFNSNLSAWDISNVMLMNFMLSNSGLSLDNYDATLIGWANMANPPTNQNLGAHGLYYCTSTANRSNLITNQGWTIQGDTEQCPFITTWKTDVLSIGGSNATSVIIPTNPNYTYNYDVDWDNDGIFDDFGLTGDATHNYGAVGTSQIAIRGTFPSIYFNGVGDSGKILDINQWGTLNWQNFEGAFAGCSSLVMSATDIPDLSNVMNMSEMFEGASVFNGDISNWDISNVTDMSYMLASTIFNGDLSTWNVSNVANMAGMFSGNSVFNGNISNWDVSNVMNMEEMFDNASAFNQDLSGWNISNVTDMTSMLSNSNLSTANYDATLTGWANILNPPSNITLGADGLTYCASTADRGNLNTNEGWTFVGDSYSCTSTYFITEWKTDNFGTSNSTSVTIPTHPAYAYSYDVDWNNDGIFDDIGVTGNITHDYVTAGTYQIAIRGTFPSIYFNAGGDAGKILDIIQWGTIDWKSFENSFYGCGVLNMSATDVPDLDDVMSMSYMFYFAFSFNGDLSNWDVSSVTNMSHMFYNASSFSSDLSNWDVSSVTTMSHMFYFAAVFNSDLSSWDVSSVTDMFSMFRYASAFNSDLTNWDVSNIMFLSYMFGNTNAFNGDLSGWDVSNATDMGFMFFQAIAFNQDLSNWDVSSVTGMSNMFNGATSFDQDLSSWDISALSYDLALDNMLSNSNLSTANYDALLTAWSQLPTLRSNISLGSTGLTYCAASHYRNNLIVLNGWTITGDSEIFGCVSVSPAVVGVCSAPTNNGVNPFTYNSQTTWQRFFSADGSQLYCEVGTNENLGNVNVNVYDAAVPRSAGSNGAAILGRNFMIDVDNQPVNPVKIRLYFTNGQFSEVQNAINGGISDPQSLTMTKYSSNNCSPTVPVGIGALVIPDNYGSVNGGYYLEFTVNSFSEFFIHENTGTTLPVEMTYFNAEKQDQSAYLTWNTSSEQNNRGFHVERSTDGTSFERISFVEGTGDSTEPKDYSYLDRNVALGVNYYRLVQEDFDGEITYSDIQQLHFGDKTNFLLYPNPVGKVNKVTLETYSEFSGKLMIQIITVDGEKTIIEQRDIIKGDSTQELDISKLSSGIYFVRLTIGEESKTIRLVK